MAIPPFSLFSAISELFVTAGVYWIVRRNWTRRPFPLGAFLAVALFEALVNVLYMANRAAAAAAGVEPVARGMKLAFAAHGTLSLLAYLAFVVLGVFAGPVDGIFGPQTETALRELREETGLRASAERLTGIYYDSEHDAHHFVFVCRPDGNSEPKPSSAEISECAYWSLDSLPRPSTGGARLPGPRG